MEKLVLLMLNEGIDENTIINVIEELVKENLKSYHNKQGDIDTSIIKAVADNRAEKTMPTQSSVNASDRILDFLKRMLIEKRGELNPKQEQDLKRAENNLQDQRDNMATVGFKKGLKKDLDSCMNACCSLSESCFNDIINLVEEFINKTSSELEINNKK